MAGLSGGRRLLCTLGKEVHATVLKEPITKSRPGPTTTVPVSRPRLSEPGEGQTPYVSPEQHSLPRSIVLHLLPGAALFGFVLVAAALGMPAILALLAGIALVIVPIELGYLLYQGRQKSRAVVGVGGR